MKVLLPFLLLAQLLVGCSPAPPDDAPGRDPTFRARSDPAAALDDDRGWAGAPGESVTVDADRPFRVRFEAERAAGRAGSSELRLQYRRNGADWTEVEAHDFPHPVRELELDLPSFDGDVDAPGGWRFLGDDASGSRLALYPPPWPVTELGLELRFPAGDRGAIAIVFAWVDAGDHGRVVVDPVAGILRASRSVAGEEKTVAEERAAIPSDLWLELEIALVAETGEVEVALGDGATGLATLTARFGEEMPAGSFGFELPVGGAELRAITAAGEARTPRVSVVSTAAYEHGAPTTDLLSGSSLPFEPGVGIDLAERTPPWRGAGSHGEFEWPLVIRRWADGAVINEEGDLFELRMVDAEGASVSETAVLRLAIPPGHVGGTFVETPGRIGPWQAANGDLYFVIEPAETDNVFMMVKSSDGGRSWREVDGANRPRTDDLESVDGRQVGDTLHLVHQVTSSVVHHAFHTSDHPTRPDRWAVRDEEVARIESIAQAASLVVRSDGSMVAFFVGDTVHYSVRSPTGSWGPDVVLDPGLEAGSAGPKAVLGADDVVHLAWYGLDGSVWYRRLLADGTLTARQQLASGLGTSRAEYGAVLPLVFVPSTSTVVVLYRQSDGRLWERRIGADGVPTPAIPVTGRRVLQEAVDSQQPEADAVLDGETVRVLFVEESSRSLFGTHDDGGWQPSELLVDGIRGSWVRGNVYTRPDGVRVLGYVYDAGSEGGAGMNRSGELVLDR